MRWYALALVALLPTLGCESAIPKAQADGQDCNFAEASTACHAGSYCDPGEPVGDRGYLRRRTYGILRDKSHVVGTCRRQGAAGAPCSMPAACVSGRCVHQTPQAPGVCE